MTRGSFLSTVKPDAIELRQHVGAAGLIGDQKLAAVADALRRDVLVGRGLLHDRGGMDAGLGGERAFADIGRVAVGRAIENFVERVRHARRAPCSFSSVTPMSNLSAYSALSFKVGMMETRLALPQRSPSPLSVP